MKSRTVLLILFLSMMSAAFAQTAPQIPEFKNSPMAINSDGSLTKLEKQTSEIKTKAKALGYGGVNNIINIEGKASPVNVTKKTEFIVKIDADVDPETVFYLTLAEVKGKGREVAVSHMSIMAGMGGKGKSVHEDDVQLKYTKVQDGVYKLTPDMPLKLGEQYAFVSTSQGATSVVYCFGVNK